MLAEVGCGYDPAKEPGENFGAAIDALAAKAMRGEGELPVILVDEYDDPVAKVLHDVPFAEKVRALLATFYGQLKDRTEKFRFLMITGVSYDAAPDKPVWLVGLPFARDTRRFVEGVV